MIFYRLQTKVNKQKLQIKTISNSLLYIKIKWIVFSFTEYCSSLVECDALVWFQTDSIKVQLHLFSINVCWFDDGMLSKQLSKFQFFRFCFHEYNLKFIDIFVLIGDELESFRLVYLCHNRCRCETKKNFHWH